MFEESHAIHAVRGVTAIPLSEEAAHIRVNTLASRAAERSPTIATSQTLDTISSALPEPPNSPDPDDAPQPQNSPPKPSPRVQFSTEAPTKLLTPDNDLNIDEHSSTPTLPLSPSDSASDISTESTAGSPVMKAIASRLSFWRKPIFPSSPSTNGDALNVDIAEEEELLSKEPQEVLATILTPAVEPLTAEERHSELDDKIVRECIKEFTKGGMYYAYNFGMSRPSPQSLVLILSRYYTVDAAQAGSDIQGATTVCVTRRFRCAALWPTISRQRRGA